MAKRTEIQEIVQILRRPRTPSRENLSNIVERTSYCIHNPVHRIWRLCCVDLFIPVYQYSFLYGTYALAYDTQYYTCICTVVYKTKRYNWIGEPTVGAFKPSK